MKYKIQYIKTVIIDTEEDYNKLKIENDFHNNILDFLNSINNPYLMDYYGTDSTIEYNYKEVKENV